MASNPNNPNPNSPNSKLFQESLKDIANIESELGESTRKFRMQIDEISSKLDETTRKTLTSYTSVNRAISDALKLSAKMAATGQESIRSKNVYNELLTEEAELTARIAALTDKKLESYDANKNIIEASIDDIKSLYKNNKDAITSTIENIEKLENQISNTVNMMHKMPLESQLRVLKAELDELVSLEDLLLKKNGSQMFSLDLMKEELEKLQKVKDTYKKIADIVKEKTEKEKTKNIYDEILSRVGLGDFSKKLKEAISPSEKSVEALGAGWARFFGIIGLTVFVLKKIADVMFKADQATTDFARSMEVSKTEARGALGNLERLSSSMKEGLFSSRDLAKSQMQINEALGTTMYMRGEDLKTVTKSREMLGLSEEAVSGIAKYSYASGMSFEDVKNNIIGASKAIQINNGIFLQDKKILEAVLKVTGGMRANFKGSITEISSAVTQAKNLGTTLDNVQTTSTGLLDFEKSIGAELEAELITGRRLNLERMRSAALVGDMKTVMEEMNKQGVDFNEFSNMNVIQQEKLAAAFNLTRDQYADMLFEQTALNKMRSLGFSGDQKNLIEEFNRLKASGADVSKLLGEQVAKTLEIQSASEKWNKVIEKFEVILERLFDNGVLDQAITGIANFVQSIADKGFLSTLIFGSNPDKPYTMQDFGGPLSGNTQTNAKISNDKTAEIVSAAVKASLAAVVPTRIIVNGVDMGIAVNKENNKFA